MRNILFLVALSVGLLACGKDSDDDTSSTPPPGPTTPVFKFTANDTAYEWNYTYLQSSTKSVGFVKKNSSGEYSLSAISDADSLLLGLPTKLLLEKTYTYSYGSSTANGFTEVRLSDVDPVNAYSASNSGDQIIVEITSISNELATGNFHAHLSVPGTPSRKLNLFGTFNNIKVVE
jgi:hypothetical protein